MNPLFSLGGSQMAIDSAIEIIKLAGKTNAPTIPIDNLIDVSKLDPAKLTAIAMKTGNKKLYDIAWNLTNGAAPKKPEAKLPVVVTAPREAPKLSVIKEKKRTKTIEEILAYRDRYRNLSILGIGLVLDCVYEIRNQGKKAMMISLKDCTVHWVTKLWEDKRVPRSHKFFKGFDCTGLAVVPLMKTDAKRGTKPYTSGPLYVSIRDGLEFCRKEGIIKLDGPVFGCTIKGADTYEKWGDMEGWLHDRVMNAS